MEYGCIGERLGHSFSKEIHNMLRDYTYELCELARDEVDGFMRRADFKAINVTIPYKETVIPYLFKIDEAAKEIGAVNTVVNKDGKLYGYNTDFYGMKRLIEYAGISLSDKKVAILGTGGTAKTARAVAISLGARSVLTVSRTPSCDQISYGELRAHHTDTQIIINTTPVGMYPNAFESAVKLGIFDKLSGVVDAVYNPLRSEIVTDALERGIPAIGGLYMLVAQAVRASEIFLSDMLDADACDRIYEKILKKKESIVLTGMPSSGKSTVGRILSERTGRELIDTDELIRQTIGCEIKEYFEKYGEAEFRKRESEVIKDICTRGGIIISTGGGAVLSKENIRNLKRNGRIYFLDRPKDALLPTSDRPLAMSKEDIEKRYNERYGIYLSTADIRIDASADANSVADMIGV